MSKKRKNIASDENYNLSADYFNKLANYQYSTDKIYDRLEKDVYRVIKLHAEKGDMQLKYPCKIDDNTFEFSWRRYKDIFNKLIFILKGRGFNVIKIGNYIDISW